MSFYILTETGDRLLVESGTDLLVTEEATANAAPPRRRYPRLRRRRR